MMNPLSPLHAEQTYGQHAPIFMFVIKGKEGKEDYFYIVAANLKAHIVCYFVVHL
jgi:hypothetical protein